MPSVRFLAMLSTFLLVVGALLVGEAIHGGVVTGEYAVTSPYVVLRLIVGVVFIALGYRFRSSAGEYVPSPSAESDESEQAADASPDDASETGEFDPELSPMGDSELEHVETDDDE